MNIHRNKAALDKMEAELAKQREGNVEIIAARAQDAKLMLRQRHAADKVR